jgi:hypothetical protein
MRAAKTNRSLRLSVKSAPRLLRNGGASQLALSMSIVMGPLQNHVRLRTDDAQESARAQKKHPGAKEAAMGKEHQHSRIEVTSTCLSCGEQIGRGDFDTRRLAKQDVDKESAAALPERDAMSLVNANLAVPINIAAALNVLSDGSIAAAAAQQNTPIDQSTGITPPSGG